MEAEVREGRTSSPAPSSSPSSTSSLSSSSHYSSQTSILIRKVKVDAADSSSIAPPFTTSPSSSAFSPSPVPNPSPSTRLLRFAEHVSSQSSTVERVATYLITSNTHAQPFIAASSSPPTSSTSPPFQPLSYPETSASSPHHASPTSSSFVSASASPFLSPPAPSSTGGSTPIGVSSPPTGQTTSQEETVTFRPNPTPTLPYTPSFYHSFSSSRFSAPQILDHLSLNASSGASFAETSAPCPRARHATSASPSSSTRPRNCDVYIGTHGVNPSLSRFAKWLRAELELQGIACFLADRARYSDARSHDIALRTINSCTFGVVIITKNSFKNLCSLQELLIFLHRKNLVPLYFDVAPSDCLARDIVEKRGAVWEKDGGELWRLYDGEEREWTEALDGLARVKEWKLEAYSGKWRDCILKAVSLLGTRLGRRSVAERERVRKERVDSSEEFPFPQNTRFAGRESELRALENLLFASNEELEGERNAEIGIRKEHPRFHTLAPDRLHRGCKQFSRDGYASRRRSDADRWQRMYVEDRDSAFINGRRKSDSERWHINLGRNEDRLLCSTTNSAASSSHIARQQGFENSWDTSHADASFNRGRTFQRFEDEIRSNRHFQRTARQRQARITKELQSTGIEASFLCAGGIACVTGPSGIGKTEMVLEYAHRFSQRYRMVLWVGGEARYLRQNYLNLSLFLGLDVGTESQVGPERGRVRTFDEQEMEAFQRVKRELQRDVPYLLIIDNLESERDWWDGRELSELLPREGATHVIVTTRLPNVLRMVPLKLSYLSGLEALSLMKGKREFTSQELDALKEIEEKLERSTFGLGMVGTLLSQLPIMPSELLGKIEKVPFSEWHWDAREEAALKNNPFLVNLLGVCFSMVDQTNSSKGFPLKMALVGGWFGPFPIPLPLLALAASMYPEKSQGFKLFRAINAACFSCCASTQSKKCEAEAMSLLVNHGLARKCSRQGWICLHEIVQLYARKRGGLQAAKAMVQSIRKRGSIPLHSELFWAASFLVLGFGNDPVSVELKVVDLLSFIRRGVLQLALQSFTSFSRCHAALELLRLSANMLENVEKLFVSQIHDRWDKSLCCKKSGYAGQPVDEYVWQDVTLLKALILETRAKLMLKGGQFDAGEEICRTCISIRTVMLGHDHPDTVCAQETLAKLVRCRSNA